MVHFYVISFAFTLLGLIELLKFWCVFPFINFENLSTILFSNFISVRYPFSLLLRFRLHMCFYHLLLNHISQIFCSIFVVFFFFCFTLGIMYLFMSLGTDSSLSCFQSAIIHKSFIYDITYIFISSYSI